MDKAKANRKAFTEKLGGTAFWGNAGAKRREQLLRRDPAAKLSAWPQGWEPLRNQRRYKIRFDRRWRPVLFKLGSLAPSFTRNFQAQKVADIKVAYVQRSATG